MEGQDVTLTYRVCIRKNKITVCARKLDKGELQHAGSSKKKGNFNNKTNLLQITFSPNWSPWYYCTVGMGEILHVDPEKNI